MKKEVIEKVKEILMDIPATRDCDHILYWWYVLNERKENGKLKSADFGTAFCNYKEFGLSSFASIGRARRKLQNKHPELRADAETQEIRLNEEIEFYNTYKGD